MSAKAHARPRLAVWTPLRGDDDAVRLRRLAERFEVTAVVADPAAVDAAALPGVGIASAPRGVDADLDLYDLDGGAAAAGFVHRACRGRPGVVMLRGWSLHALVLRLSLEEGDRAGYLREMERAYGDAGAAVGRQVLGGAGGLLPRLLPLNEPVLDGCLALVAPTAWTAARAALRLRGRPVLHLPEPVAFPETPLPSAAEARRGLGLPEGARLITVAGDAAASSRLDLAVRTLARLQPRHPGVRLVIAGQLDRGVPAAGWASDAGLAEAVIVTGRLDPGRLREHLAASDVVWGLRFPDDPDGSGAVARGLAAGRPVLVTGGGASASDFPDGCVVPVDPGPDEGAHAEALLSRLLSDPELCAAIGRLGRAHVAARTADDGARRLAAFLEEVAARKAALAAELERRRAPAGSLKERLLGEARRAVLGLGVPGLVPDAEAIAADLWDWPG